jgi:hypothetical protein
MLVEFESWDPSTRVHFTTVVGKGLAMDIMDAVYNSSTCLQFLHVQATRDSVHYFWLTVGIIVIMY